jgi:tetratricopeptide (TPR) repeat protein
VRDGVSLDREMLRDATANPESLPLLQHALQQLYDQREGRMLRWETYLPPGREGGLSGLLVTVAEGLIAGIPGDADAVFRRVMRELTSVSEDGSATRRYADQEAFPADSPERGFIERLVEARLAVTDRHGAEPVVYLAHEALLRSWPRVRTWLIKESSLLRLRDEVQRDARAWATHGRSAGWLGTAPDKLATLEQLEREGLIPAGTIAEYAGRSRARARRNQFLKTAIAASICMLTVLSIIEAANALKQRNRAVAEATTADRTARFMVSLFKLADPGESRGNSVTVREVLDKGARDIGRSLENEPKIRADLLTAMGEAYTGLGLYEPARPLLARARADQATVSVPAESQVRTLIASGFLQDEADDLEGAKGLLRRALDLGTAQLPASSLLISDARDDLADVLIQLKQYPEAKQLCETALTFDRKRGPEGAATLARTLDTLAQALAAEGHLEEAEAPTREALAINQRAFGARDVSTAMSLNNLAALLYQQGRYSDAATQWAQALPLYREVFGAEHPEVATLLNNVGRSKLMAGDVPGAISLLSQAVQMGEKLWGPTHEYLVLPLNSLGMAYLYQGDLKNARTVIDRALQIARPRNHQILDQIVLNSADLALSTRSPQTAEPLLAEARRLLLARYPHKDGADQWRYAVWDSVNAELLAQENHPDAARAAFIGARTVLVQRYGSGGFFVMRLDQRAGGLASAKAAKPD